MLKNMWGILQHLRRPPVHQEGWRCGRSEDRLGLWRNSRGVQSGEADRHTVWLRDQALEPQLGGFNPRAILDEVQELFPGYTLGHTRLVSGDRKSAKCFEDLDTDQVIAPANDDLFSSLGRYSRALNEVLEHDLQLPYEHELSL
jgi:hypothetical protein